MKDNNAMDRNERAVAPGFQNYWKFTMTNPLGHLGRYPA